MRIELRAYSVLIEGYVNAIERNSKPLTSRIGKFVERICKGAFSNALKRRDEVFVLLNHDPDRVLGSTKEGNLELTEDNIGLHARAVITDKDVIEQARKGDLVGWSFGFTDRDVETGEENGMVVRNVKDLDLFEVSLINRAKIPAYDGTLVAVRTDDKALNISDITEVEPTIEEEPQEPQERAEEPVKEDNHADEENGAIDYTVYRNMIKEMKGE
jgi:HK97 family phage prohead protease